MLLPEIMQNTSLTENEIANTRLFFVYPFSQLSLDVYKTLIKNS